MRSKTEQINTSKQIKALVRLRRGIHRDTCSAIRLGEMGLYRKLEGAYQAACKLIDEEYRKEQA